jgi:hypothetical protein
MEGRNSGIIAPGWKKWEVFFADNCNSRYFRNGKRTAMPQADHDATGLAKNMGQERIAMEAALDQGAESSICAARSRASAVRQQAAAGG